MILGLGQILVFIGIFVTAAGIWYTGYQLAKVARAIHDDIKHSQEKLEKKIQKDK